MVKGVSTRTGQNNPCLCGSGKRYNKCCGMRGAMDPCLPDELLTGTPIDRYIMLLQAVAIFYEAFLNVDPEGPELSRIAGNFDRAFRPGTPEGISDSLFLPWLYFDVAFGATGKTVGSRFLESASRKRLTEQDLTLFRHLSVSYAAMYEVTGLTRNQILFRELATDIKWRVHRVPEPYDPEIRRRGIWYTRLVGPSDNAYVLSTPYVFPYEAMPAIESVMEAHRQTVKPLKTSTDRDMAFREVCKSTLHAWVNYLLKGLTRTTPPAHPFS